MFWRAFLQGSLPGLSSNFQKNSKSELTSCSTLTSQQEVSLGNPRDFRALHRSLGLPIDSVNFSYLQKTFSFY